MRQRTRQARQESGEAVLDAIEALIAEGGLAAVNAREVARRAGIAVGSVYLVHGTLDRAVSLANGRTLAKLDQAMAEAVADVSLHTAFHGALHGTPHGTPQGTGHLQNTAHDTSPGSAPYIEPATEPGQASPAGTSSGAPQDSVPPGTSPRDSAPQDAAPADDVQAGLARCLALGRCYVRFARTHREAWTAITAFTPADKALLSMHHDALEGLVARIVDALRMVRPDLDDATLAVRARTFFAAVHGVVHTALEGWFMGTPAGMLDAEIDVLVRGLVHGLSTGA